MQSRQLLTIFESPRMYPVAIELGGSSIHFVEMSQEMYRRSVFLDRRIHHLGASTWQIRMDDLLLLSNESPPLEKKHVHYVLHTTFCCSTLLARYFEQFRSCLVLKEPMLLTQLAANGEIPGSKWQEIFQLALRLLTRTYDHQEFVVIKPHEPCNSLAPKLLAERSNCTITFLLPLLEDFLLAVLKSKFRRQWVRSRVPAAGQAAGHPVLSDLRQTDMADAEAAAYLWAVNRFLALRLAAGSTRVQLLSSDLIAAAPKHALESILSVSGIPRAPELLSIFNSQPGTLYSKDPSRSFDADSRRVELENLSEQLAAEVEVGIRWALLHDHSLSESDLVRPKNDSPRSSHSRGMASC